MENMEYWDDHMEIMEEDHPEIKEDYWDDYTEIKEEHWDVVTAIEDKYWDEHLVKDNGEWESCIGIQGLCIGIRQLFVEDKTNYGKFTYPSEEEEDGTQVEERTPAEVMTPATLICTDELESYCETPEAAVYFHKLVTALRKDHSNRFIKLIQREKLLGTVRRAGIVFDPQLLFYRAVKAGAGDCAAWMLKGDSGLEIDINRRPNYLYYPEPLIVAATSFQPEMVNLLADNGARF